MTATASRPTTIEADPAVPAIHLTRDFAAPVAAVMTAHTDPELFARWIGPADLATEIDSWDCRTGGSWRYTTRREGFVSSFRGCFHEVSPTRIVQTFTWEGMPEQVALETLTLADLGDGRTRLRVTSLCDSFESRDAWLRSGMETGVTEGYAALEALLVGERPA